MAKILITGGTGLVGQRLSELLHQKNHEVIHLSRNPGKKNQYKTYKWDIGECFIDEEAFRGIDGIIHLAGAGVAEKKWTDERKKVILDSRVDGIKLLLHYVKKQNVALKQFISASAIGIYGADTGTELQTETSNSGDDFLADVTKKWEAEADSFKELCPVTKLRIGVVLSDEGGAMKEILKPIKYYVGAPLGSGDQVMSWIHIDDLANMFVYAFENELAGTYNATAPNPVSNEAMTKALAKAANKPLWLPNVPAFVMKLMLGEMSQIVLGGSNVSSSKIQEVGFKFQFSQVEDAVNDLIG